MSNYYIGTPTEGIVLYHHGVKGMKWGVRKQRELISRRNGSSDGMSIEQQKAARRAKAKKYAKIGAAVAVTALAAYGGYKMYKIKSGNIAADKATARAYKLMTGKTGRTISSRYNMGYSRYDGLGVTAKDLVKRPTGTKFKYNNAGMYSVKTTKKLKGHSQPLTPLAQSKRRTDAARKTFDEASARLNKNQSAAAARSYDRARTNFRKEYENYIDRMDRGQTITPSPIPKLRKQTGPKKLRVSSKQHSRNRYGW